MTATTSELAGRSLGYQRRQPSAEIEPTRVFVLVVVFHISAAWRNPHPLPELGVLAGDLTVTGPSAGKRYEILNLGGSIDKAAVQEVDMKSSKEEYKALQGSEMGGNHGCKMNSYVDDHWSSAFKVCICVAAIGTT